MFNNERFAAGVDFADFVAAKGADGPKYASAYQAVEVAPADREFFQAIAAPVNVVAFSESWCPDCANNVPVAAKIAALSPNIRLKLFPRDSVYMEDYQTNGRRTIPTIVFFDSAFNEIGRWIEHPRAVRERFAAGDDVWQSETRERYNRGEYRGEVIREFREILQGK